jgi:hypothetical protein
MNETVFLSVYSVSEIMFLFIQNDDRISLECCPQETYSLVEETDINDKS